MRLLAIFFIFAVPACAQQRTVLLELFTSEGCSSCPPADKLLQQLSNTRTAKGDLILVLSEHVTYWNSLGWRDPFSTDNATARQQAFVDRLHTTEVYTPQMVVNGEAEVLGSDRNAISTAIQKLHRPTNASIKIGSAHSAGKDLAVSFSVAGITSLVDVYVAITEDTVSSTVPRGENSGRTLTHVNVVNSLTKVATRSAAGDNTVHVPAPADSRKHHIVVFLQQPNFGPILTVDSTPL